MSRRRIILDDDIQCPNCGSKNIIGAGSYWRTIKKPTGKVQMLRCNECGHPFSSGIIKGNGGK